MSTPSAVAVGSDAANQTPASPAANDDNNTGGIPRRSMRVKVLYTFDNQNKSNCLARLPNALPIPVVSLDEDTQVGVIDLKTCIQAIVTASPELTAKLGHDYTVYAYDFSEYETPLVGQGMLSWILASASATPNAPADESQTMVTGRVCKNILGLFSNGIKETLEVKLKLVPVPSSMQKEYVENMERYHSLSQIMPEGFDYPAWSDFLKENPTLGQLAQPTPITPSQHMHRSSTGGYEPFHQMLTRHSPSQEPSRNDSFHKQSFMSQPSRASSPARSISSFRHIPYNPEPRPSSRTSIRSEQSTRSHQYPADPYYTIEYQQDGPPKKRARITQATRPRNTPLTTRSDSLHKTAATASSAWLHRPIAVNAASSFADNEMQPRAPTPRPGDRAFGARQQRRMPAPSALRHGSMDAGRSYVSPYDAGAYSDAPVDSGDDEREESPDGTPRDIPSSPPIVHHATSLEPSSPTLPTFPQLTDSGFVSDAPLSREEDRPQTGNTVQDNIDLTARKKAWLAARGVVTDPIPDSSDLAAGKKVWLAPRGVPNDATIRRKQLARQEVVPYNKSHKVWQEVNPGPAARLPQTYNPPPRSFSRNPYHKQVAQSIETDNGQAKPIAPNASRANAPSLPRSQTMQEGSNANGSAKTRQPPTDSSPFPPVGKAQTAGKAGSPESMYSQGSPESEAGAQVYSREATPNATSKEQKASKSKGLPRSQTWSGTGEPMSDLPTPSGTTNRDSKVSRSGGHAKRKKYIQDKLSEALKCGELPDHCHNCGEIETPTWRKPYTRVMYGTPEGIELSSTGIVAFEVIKTEPEKGDEPMYRIYRNKISREDRIANVYENMQLCNPCGLYLVKNGHSRPRFMWEKFQKSKAKSKRGKSKSQNDADASDATTPSAEAAGPEDEETSANQTLAPADKAMPPPFSLPKPSSPANTDVAQRDDSLTNEDCASKDDVASKDDCTKNDDSAKKDGGADRDGDANDDDVAKQDDVADTDGTLKEKNVTNQDQVPVSAATEAAFKRAIQSSPAGFRKSQEPLADTVDPDLTPKPTRRLLFPSPRKAGEVKSLGSAPNPWADANTRALQLGVPVCKLPRCISCRDAKRACDRQRPCGRCVSRGMTFDQCIPVVHIAEFSQSIGMPTNASAACAAPGVQATTSSTDKPAVASVAVSSTTQTQPDASTSATAEDGDAAVSPTPQTQADASALANVDDEEIDEVDKENCPPPASDQEDDDLAYLFETPASAKTTPRKTPSKEDDAFAEFIKTPTPGSRRRLPLTPRRGGIDNIEARTPSRSAFTPRSTRSVTAGPDTPFTRQLNEMLSEANNSSPSQIFDFSAFPVFDTPARASGAQFSDLFNAEYLSSDMPMSSSPARAAMTGIGFDLYEDPNTASVGIWNESSMFSSDTIMADADDDVRSGTESSEVSGGTAMLKMTVGGVTVDFASMIEEVVNNNDHETDVVEMEETSPEATETQLSPELTKTQSTTDPEVTETQTSPEAMSQGLVQTPDAPDAD